MNITSTPLNTEKIGILTLYLASFFWGSAFIAQKILVSSNVPPFYMVGLRMIFSLLPLIFIIKIPLKITTIKKTALMGMVIFLVFGLQTIGLKTIDSSVSSFITSLNLVIIPFINFFTYRTKIIFVNIISIIIALIGVYFFNISADFQLTLNIGMILTLLCALFCAIQLVLGSQFIKGENPLQFSTFQNLFCGVYAFIFAFIFEWHDVKILTWSSTEYLAITYLGIIASSLCFLLLSIGQRYIKNIVKISLILALQPLFTILIAIPLLGDRITIFKIIGIICIMSAIFIDEYFGKSVVHNSIKE